MLAPQKAEVNTNTVPQIFYLFLMCEGDVLDVFECWKCQPCQPCQPFSLIRIPLHSPWCRNLRQRTWILGSSFAYVWSLELCGALRSFAELLWLPAAQILFAFFERFEAGWNRWNLKVLE